MTEKKVLTSHAYLLFYNRREVQPATEITDQSGVEISTYVPIHDLAKGQEHWISKFNVKIAPPVEPQAATPKATPPTPSHQVMGPALRRSNTAPPHRRRGEEKHPNSLTRKKIEETHTDKFGSTGVNVPTYNIAQQTQPNVLTQTPSVPNFTGLDQSFPITFTPPTMRYQFPIKKTVSQPNIPGVQSPAAVRSRPVNETSV